jgi:glycosyltransferase involved in cell wall biosynthesis
MNPRLTIGIPTRNRPEMLRRAIDSAFAQTEPVRIVVNDSGSCSRTRRTCEGLVGENFEYIRRDGGSLWENWKHVARQANTEFFMWLQDDDVIVPKLAKRIINAFDRYPKAKVYCTRLYFSYDGRLGLPWYGIVGPKVPLDYLKMQPTEFPGLLLTGIGYFEVWAISPGKAFRTGEPFRLMLDLLPDGCDKYTERLDVAFMGLHGTAIADPNIAGLSVLHGQNEADLTVSQERSQAVIAHKFMDMLAESEPGWKEAVFDWIDTPGSFHLFQHCINMLSKNIELSKNSKALYEMFGAALRALNGMPI